jgi:hypothetical protein
MKSPKARFVLSLTAIAVVSATPATAVAAEEAVVPPSNSAATQYTETFPTTGGDKKTDQKPKQRSPTKVLGSNNVKKLEKQGPEGKAAAEAAAATAPTAIAPAPAPTSSSPTEANGAGGSKGGSGSPDKGTGGTGENGASGAPKPKSETGISTPTDVPTSEPAGSSGVGSAVEQATGLSTSGQSGMLLPLVILATIIWAIAYFWRQRRQVD